ncbi:MAG: hypothetical protein JWR00_2821 [Rubritepida sp.]|nr:hypothetical protein [Rubritepida sp.]
MNRRVFRDADGNLIQAICRRGDWQRCRKTFRWTCANAWWQGSPSGTVTIQRRPALESASRSPIAGGVPEHPLVPECLPMPVRRVDGRCSYFIADRLHGTIDDSVSSISKILTAQPARCRDKGGNFPTLGGANIRRGPSCRRTLHHSPAIQRRRSLFRIPGLIIAMCGLVVLTSGRRCGQWTSS